MSGQNAGAICKAVNDVIECLSVLSLHGGLPKGKGLTKMSELIELLFMDNQGLTSFDTRLKMKSFYRFHVERKMEVRKKTGFFQMFRNYFRWCR